MSKRMRLINSLAVFMILFGVVTTSIAGTTTQSAGQTCDAPAAQ